MRSACDTSVRDTAMNPPMSVYVATATSVRTTRRGEVEPEDLLQQL